MTEASAALDGRIVIIGAGHAGGTAAALLHQHGWTGSITLVGAESRAPYQRPPLSKGLMLGKTQPEELALKPEGFYAQKQIDLVTSRRVMRITAMRAQCCSTTATRCLTTNSSSPQAPACTCSPFPVRTCKA